MRPLERFGGLALASLLVGCATSELALAPDRPDRPWNPPVEDGEIVATAPSHEPPPGGYVLPANPVMARVEPPPVLEGGHAYTLAELIDLAESQNPQTHIAWAQAREAALAAGISRSAFLPALTATVIGGYQSGHQDKTVDAQSVSEQSTASGSISALSLKWLLFDFGGRAAALNAAKQVSVISNIGFTAAHQNLIYRVSLAFYADAAARARQATAAQSLKDAQAVQAAADARFAHGEGTIVETAQARQAAVQAEYARIRADGAADEARQTLINAMGVSPLTKLTVEDVAHRKLSTEAGAPIDELVSAALSRRPDVLSAYAAHEATLAKVREARAQFMPKVFLSASGAYSDGGLAVTGVPGFGEEGPLLNLSGNGLGGTVLLGVTVPLYDGGMRDAALKRAHAEADRAAGQLAQVRGDAAREVVSAATSVKTSVTAHGAALALVSASQTSFDSALASYKHGAGSITDVTLAESKLLEARNSATDAYSAALSAAAGLAFAAGALGAPPPP